MTVLDLKNWRFNPFTNVVHDATITDELHTISYHDDWNAYGIQTNEMPLFENPSSLSIKKVSDSSLFTEVPRSQAPQPGEYRVDYDGETYFGTGRCEFNIGDNGIAVKVTYQGTGSVIKNRNTLGASTFPADVIVDGETTLNDATIIDSTLNVTGKTTVDDMDATGTVVFTGVPTINAAPSASTDAVRKSYADSLYNKIYATVSKTADYQILDTDEFSTIECDTTSNDVDVTLPTIADNYGKRFRVIHTTKGGTNKTTINSEDAGKLTNDNLTVIWLPDSEDYIEVFASAEADRWIIISEKITSKIYMYGFTAWGAVDTKIVRFATESVNKGNLITYDNTANNGFRATIIKTGWYSIISRVQNSNAGQQQHGISVNSNQLTTAIASITETNIVTCTACSGSSPALDFETVSSVSKFYAGDIIRVHGNAASTHNAVSVVIEYCSCG